MDEHKREGGETITEVKWNVIVYVKAQRWTGRGWMDE